MVIEGVCVPCPSWATRPAGDLPSEGNTKCFTDRTDIETAREIELERRSVKADKKSRTSKTKPSSKGGWSPEWRKLHPGDLLTGDYSGDELPNWRLVAGILFGLLIIGCISWILNEQGWRRHYRHYIETLHKARVDLADYKYRHKDDLRTAAEEKHEALSRERSASKALGDLHQSQDILNKTYLRLKGQCESQGKELQTLRTQRDQVSDFTNKLATANAQRDTAVGRARRQSIELKEAKSIIHGLEESHEMQASKITALTTELADAKYEVQERDGQLEHGAKKARKARRKQKAELETARTEIRATNARLQAVTEELERTKCARDNAERGRLAAQRRLQSQRPMQGGYDAMARQFRVGQSQPGEPSHAALSTVYPPEGAASPRSSNRSVISGAEE